MVRTRVVSNNCLNPPQALLETVGTTGSSKEVRSNGQKVNGVLWEPSLELDVHRWGHIGTGKMHPLTVFSQVGKTPDMKSNKNIGKDLQSSLWCQRTNTKSHRGRKQSFQPVVERRQGQMIGKLHPA